MNFENSEPATKLRHTDASSSLRLDGTETFEKHYQRMELWNRLDWNYKWRDEREERDKDRDAILDAVGSQLELKDHQFDRTDEILETVPDSMKQGYRISLLVFCAAAHAVRPDGRTYHPGREANDPVFLWFLREADFSTQEVAQCYHRLQSRNEVWLP